MSHSLLELKNLGVSFELDDETVDAVRGISFTLKKGETHALVGESGSGKSVAALSIMQLNPESTTRYSAGSSIRFNDQELIRADEKSMLNLRGRRMTMIFQEPMSSLNPYLTVGFQLIEIIVLHQKINKRSAREQVVELLSLVGMETPTGMLRRYPHEFSGGQLQRIMIAMAIANEPEILIADEPTTALDVTIQVQVLHLLKQLQQRMNMAILFITHDLGVAKSFCDTISVMHEGRIVESGKSEKVFANPQHPYTITLLSSVARGRKSHIQARTPVLIKANDIRVKFPIKYNLFGKITEYFAAVKGIDITIREGETLAIVGESGSGKSTLGRAIMQMLPYEGTVQFRQHKLSTMYKSKLRRLRKNFQIVFQDPFNSLSPRFTVGEIVGEGLQIHCPELNKQQRFARVQRALTEVSVDPNWINRYPHELSGGQRQRIAIARAVILQPAFILLDEPTSALDRSVQVKVIELLRNLQKTHGLSYLFISHDLSVVKAMADHVLVMKQGAVVESNSAENLFSSPQMDYTKDLLNAALLHS